MKQTVNRELLKVRGKTVELYKMEGGTYQAFAHTNYDAEDEEDEIVGMGEHDIPGSAIKLAIQDLQAQLKNTQ